VIFIALTLTANGKVVYDVDALFLSYHNRPEAASSEASFFNTQFYISKASIVGKSTSLKFTFPP